MSKSTTITIAGVKFKATSEAERKLADYLSRLNSHFNNYPDGQEIYTDFESRIAEKLQDLTRESKEVVSEADAAKVISAMGEIADFEPETSNATSESLQSRILDKFKFSRLRRDVDNQKIAGVCAGIANYLEIDPVIVRLAFCLTTLLFFVFWLQPFVFLPVLLYLGLWLSMPEAKSVTEKLESKGEKVTVASVTKAVAENKSEAAREKGRLERIVNIPIDAISRVAKFCINIVKVITPIGVRLGGLGLFAASMFAITALTSLALVFLNNPDSEYIGLPVLLLVNKDAQMLRLITVLVFLVALIPLVYSFVFSISMLRLKNLFRTLPSLVGFGIWIIAIVALTVVGSANINNARNAIQYNPGIFTPAESAVELVSRGDYGRVNIEGDITVEVSYADTPSGKVIAMNRDLADIDMEIVDGVLNIKYERSFNNFCLLCIYYQPRVQLEYPKFIEAKMNSGTLVVEGFKDEVTLNLSGQSQFFATSDFIKVNLNQEDIAYSKFDGDMGSLHITASDASIVNNIDSETQYVELNADGAVSGYLNAEQKMIINAKGGGYIYYIAGGELFVTKDDEVYVMPYRFAIGHMPSLKDVKDFLSYEDRYSTFVEFMGHKRERITNNGEGYVYRLYDGEEIYVTFDRSRDKLLSVLLEGSGVDLMKP